MLSSAVDVENINLSANSVAFISCRHRIRLQLIEATVLAESSLYFIFSLGFFCSSDVYRHESGRCCTLPCFLTFFISVILLFQKSPQKTKAHVNAVFFRQLRQLLSVVVPGPFSPEMGFLWLIALSLISRTLCDLWLIHNATYIEK